MLDVQFGGLMSENSSSSDHFVQCWKYALLESVLNYVILITVTLRLHRCYILSFLQRHWNYFCLRNIFINIRLTFF